MTFANIIASIEPLDEAAMAKARERQAQLAKPPGSLGRLEDLSVQLAGITGSVHNKIEKKHLLVLRMVMCISVMQEKSTFPSGAFIKSKNSPPIMKIPSAI